MSDQKDDVEKEILSRDAAKVLAEKYKPKIETETIPIPQKIKVIPYSLLSAEHIVDVVKETGLIAPLYTGGGKKSRLKKAAYEGRIGTKAFVYNADGQLEQTFDKESNEFLKLPKNSIVFVECDLDFRLPEFIALRFNLQIQHVHRGLLLGTGPLVDPGFWGKLCIPLHNLTDEDYYIPRDEGIIWIEFTKTTSEPEDAERIGRKPFDGKEFWDISKFLNKASRQYRCKSVPIRSSLETMFADTTKQAKEAAKNAEKAANSAKRMQYIGAFAGAIAVIGIAIGLITLWQSYYSDMNQQYDNIRPRIEKLENKVSSQVQAIELSANINTETSSLVSDNSNLMNGSLSRIEELENQNAQQEKENKELRERMDELERQILAQQSTPTAPNIAPQ